MTKAEIILIIAVCLIATYSTIMIFMLSYKVAYYERKFLNRRHLMSAEEWSQIQKMIDKFKPFV